MKLLLVLALAALLAVEGALDYKRVHLVDVSPRPQGGNNYFFRGNMPTNDTTFSYDLLSQYLTSRAKEANFTLPRDYYLIVISLNNGFDADLAKEQDFWGKKEHDTLGKFINWPLGMAGLLPPNLYPEDERKKMANSTVWGVDKIPDRVQDINTMLKQGRPDRAVAIYVHCTAGCDRTGEVVGSYRMQYTVHNGIKMYNLNCAECGRPPNYWSTTAQQWYCYYYQYRFNTQVLGDCMGFATCKMFGDCKPTHPNTTDASVALKPVGLPSPLFELPASLVADLGKQDD